MQDLSELEQELRDALAAAQAKGWGRDDVVRVLRRDRVHGRAWEVVANLERGLEVWAGERQVPDDEVRQAASMALTSLRGLPPLPGQPRGGGGATGDEADPALVAKVRALLAKAESTSFPAEAEALTAKAYELMSRHAITEALLAGPPGISNVVTRRIFIEGSYARAQFHLVGAIARACGCRAIFWTGFKLAVVVGFAADADATEMLYTSLLVQALAGMAGADTSRADDPGFEPAHDLTPSRKAAFRRAYLLAFAGRIEERLAEARRHSIDEARRDLGESVLPVLASRDVAVADAIAEMFPRVKSMRTSASDGQGWRAGRDAADRATLVNQPSLPNLPNQLRRPQ